MIICRSISEIRAAVKALRENGTIGLVTTMGALHAGHMALVQAAVQDNDSVVATIFVNPTQFGNPDDLENYPRTEQEDLNALREAGTAAVFIPTKQEMYPKGDQTIVETTQLANVLHGQVRPGHFRGVATVVTKLFNIVGADSAYFGKKDYQQLAVIRRMVEDLHMNIRIKGIDTVREDDGLALSSRNVRLTAEHRAVAPIMNRALTDAESLLKSGATVEAAQSMISETIDE